MGRLCRTAPGLPAGPGAACAAGRWLGLGTAPPWARPPGPHSPVPTDLSRHSTEDPQPLAGSSQNCPSPALSRPQPQTGVTGVAGEGSGGPTRHCWPPAALCHAELFHAALCQPAPRLAAPYDGMPCCATPCHALLCRGTLCRRHCASLCRATFCNAARCLTAASPGTTWMQEILTLLFSHGDVLPAKTIPNWERAPWLEQIYFRDALRDTAAPRLITTHLPARVLAPALQQSKAKVRGGWDGPGGPHAGSPGHRASCSWGDCRGLSEWNPPSCGADAVPPQVIYVARNPKDVAVSFYHFHRLAKFLPDPGSFDTFLMQFLEGTGKDQEVPSVPGLSHGVPPSSPPLPSALRLLV